MIRGGERNASSILVLATDVGTRGGIQRYTRHLLESLSELYGPETVRACFLWKTASPPGFREKVAFTFSGIVEARRARPTLVIGTHVGVARVAAFLNVVGGVPYLVLAHGDEVWGTAPSFVLRGAEAVICVSRFTADRLIGRHGVDSGKIRLLPPAFDPGLLRSPISPERVIERHRLHGRRVLLTVGRVTRKGRYKGYEMVIRALARIRTALPNVVYVIVGEGDDRPRLEGLARELGVGDAVQFAGDVEDAWLPAYYRSCDLFVMPSRVRLDDPCEGEGFGIVYLEAAAFGKPAIAGREGGSAEAVLDGVTGVLVDPSDSEAIAHAILDLLRNEAWRSKLGENARERAWREFTRERFRHRLAAIVSEWVPLKGAP